MSGHSKWANIKRRKEKMDAQKGKLFTKLGRELITAARLGGPDPGANSRLKLAIQKAKEANMPQETITRAIQRGTKGGEEAEYEEVVYEGYGPEGIAVLLNLLTDNRNRTAATVRHLFSRYGGNLGEAGCVAWMFTRKGFLTLNPAENKKDEEELMLLAIETGAEDVSINAGVVEVITTPENLETVKEGLSAQGVKIATAEVTMVPQITVPLTEKEQALRVLKFLDVLDDLDEVQAIYTNFEIPQSLASELEAKAGNF